MNRGEILDQAKALTMGDRNRTHGDFVRQHATCARLWEAYKGVRYSPEDVALMLLLLKVSRIMVGETNTDNYVDGSAYMAGAGECRAVAHAAWLGEDEE